MTNAPITRLLVLAFCFVAGSVAIARVSTTEAVPVRRSFAEFPYGLRGWTGIQAPDFDDRVMSKLGVDDYLNRVYFDDRRNAVGVYVGYYESQREGDTIHSPLNCLPGAGWQPIQKGSLALDVDAGGRRGMRRIEVNRFLIQKGLDRQVVLYWYQSHGRVVASEYWGKVYMVVDAMRYNRTDGALIRVIAPVGTTGDAEGRAESVARSFVETLYPLLGEYLPS